jgi:hypothetical protein
VLLERGSGWFGRGVGVDVEATAGVVARRESAEPGAAGATVVVAEGIAEDEDDGGGFSEWRADDSAVNRSAAGRVRTWPAAYTARIAVELNATRPLATRWFAPRFFSGATARL